jgi:hypothetical protein
MSDLPMGEERRARGRAARQQAPRSTHDAIGNVDRDPVELLKQSSAGRVEALVPLRYGRMLVSPFTFYRGSAILQAHDLAGTPDSGIHMQICGDCHLSNFGGFATPERSLIFDLNDFDETAVGPWEWDVKRLVASFTIAGRHLGHGDAAADEFAFCAAESYRTRMGEYADMGVLDLWYERITFDRMYDAVQTDDARRRIKRGVERATRRTHETMLPKLADRTENEWQIRDAPPAIFHIRGKNTLFDPDDDVMSLTAHRDDILAPVLSEYFSSLTVERAALLKQFTIQDLVFKVVGVGSVGTRCMVLLLIEPHGKPLFLQLKEASKSVVSMFFKGAPDDPADPSHAGRRVVHGQRLMQAATDLFLGWSTGPLGRALYVRVSRLRCTVRMGARPRAREGERASARNRRVSRLRPAHGGRARTLRPRVCGPGRKRLRRVSRGVSRRTARGALGCRHGRGLRALNAEHALPRVRFVSVPHRQCQLRLPVLRGALVGIDGEREYRRQRIR